MSRIDVPDVQAWKEWEEQQSVVTSAVQRDRRWGGTREDGGAAVLMATGLAFVFIYAAVSAMMNPAAYRSFLPGFLDEAPSWVAEGALRSFGLVEVAVALGVLTRRYRYLASLVAAVTLVAIIAVNLNAFDILFRNVAIALAALALADLSQRAAS